MEKTTTVSYIMTGDGNIFDLQKALKRGIDLGATKYHCHLQYSCNEPYVQMIEFIKQFSVQELLEKEKKELEERLENIKNEIKLLGDE